MKIAVILTVYNRKKLTLRCLRSLFSSELSSNIEMSVFMVDDNSSDGTAEVVQKEFPYVHVINGTGSLYWSGGMRLGWECALKEGADYFLWLNDDTVVFSRAIEDVLRVTIALEASQGNVGAVVGTIADERSGDAIYGGRTKLLGSGFGPVIRGDSKPVECDYINGNFTLIPIKAVCKIGIISEAFTHGLGDFDYGLRLKKAGMTCWVAGGFQGEGCLNSVEGTWMDETLSPFDRYAKTNMINQCPPVGEWDIYIRRHFGIFYPLMKLKLMVRVYIPYVWLFIKSRKKRQFIRRFMEGL